MKLEGMKALRAGVMGLVELVLALPALLFINLYVVESPTFWVWLVTFSCFYVAGCLLLLMWKKSVKIVRHLLFIALSALYGWMWFDISIAAALSLVIGWVALIRGGKYATLPVRKALSVNIYVFSIVIYFLLAAVTRFVEDMEPIVQPLSWFALATLGITMFMLNNNALDQESFQRESKQAVGKPVLWKNRILICLFAVIVVLVANFGLLLDAFQAVFRKIVEWINWLLSLGTDGEPVDEIPPGSNTQAEFPMDADQEPALFWVILETIAKWAVLILGVVAAVYLLIKIGRMLIRGVKALYAWIMDRLASGELDGLQHQDYEDEVEKLADWNDLRKQWGDRFKSLFEREQRDRWNKLTNNLDRMRFLYRTAVSRIIQDGYRYKASLTPRETKSDADRWKGGEALPDELVRYYEQARYSGKEPSDEQIASIRKRLDV